MKNKAHLIPLLVAMSALSFQLPALAQSASSPGLQHASGQSSPLHSVEVQPLPPAAAQRLDSLYPRLQPSVRAWLQEQSRRQLSLPTVDPESVRSAARSRFAPPPKGPAAPTLNTPGARMTTGKPGLGPATQVGNTGAPVNLSEMDIDALVQIVMTQCAKDSEADLKDLLSEMQRRQKQKAEMRALMEELRKERAALGAPDTPCASPACRALEGRFRALASQLPAQARPNLQPVKTVGDLAGMEGKLKGALDTMSDLSEEQSLRLQQAMERRSKLLSTLSNLMKKQSSTSDAIIANLK